MAKTLDQYNKKYDWSLEMFFYIFLKKKKNKLLTLIWWHFILWLILK